MGTDEVASVLGYAQTTTVLRLIREEGLPAVRFNRRYYVNEADLRAWMAERGLLDESAAPTAPTAGTSTDADSGWLAATLAKFSPDDLRRVARVLRSVADDHARELRTAAEQHD
ncbi:MAG: helix-turn-helix domain-containing protein, partial [Actinomycetia bacterium]|nr:helix-turn-helix domain-containing protein [Actinomycetes bacterium]